MRFIAAILALAITAITATAQERRSFPVARAVGNGINRVVGFPFRVAAAAVGFNGNRQNFRTIRVHAPQQIRIQRIGAAHHYVPQQIRVQRIGAAYHHNNVEQIRVQRIGAAYHHNVEQIRSVAPIVVTQVQHQPYSAVAGAVSQVYTDPIVTERFAAPVLREIVQPEVQCITTQRVTTGACGSVSGFRY